MSDIVGQIALELNLDSSKFRKSLKNLNKTADNAAKSMKSSFSGAFKKIAGAAAAAFSAAAVIKFGKDCVESAASVNAANSQLSQTFGNLQGNAEAAMKRVADSSGIVQSRLQGVGTSIYAFANSLWSDCLKSIFDKLIAVITKLWNEIIYPLWEKLLKPLCDWIVKVLGPVFKTVFNVIGEVCKDCFSVIGGVIGGILDALGGLIDFISGIFTGDWEKAWKGISDFFKGIWDGIWSIIKFIINLIIDGINMLWSGIWADRNYEPAPGTIIFFDWKGDGVTDHTGIVQKCENGTVYTVEGNSGDTCRTKTYPIRSSVIYGYGIPAY